MRFYGKQILPLGQKNLPLRHLINDYTNDLLPALLHFACGELFAVFSYRQTDLPEYAQTLYKILPAIQIEKHQEEKK